MTEAISSSKNAIVGLEIAASLAKLAPRNDGKGLAMTIIKEGMTLH